MKKILSSLLILSAFLLLSACNDDDHERKIPISEVPNNVINIMKNTLPGIDLQEAEVESNNGVNIYELEGKLDNGKEYEIKITESGTIVKIELDD